LSRHLQTVLAKELVDVAAHDDQLTTNCGLSQVFDRAQAEVSPDSKPSAALREASPLQGAFPS
jgi:hypothetical protein